MQQIIDSAKEHRNLMLDLRAAFMEPERSTREILERRREALTKRLGIIIRSCDATADDAGSGTVDSTESLSG